MTIKKELEIKYLEMPISIEQKKEYNSQGFRVIDARFKPADLVDDEKARKAAERKAARAAARAAKETEQDEETEQEDEE